jgi:RNA polymerase sigma-70 factor (ECF subfamily)
LQRGKESGRGYNQRRGGERHESHHVAEPPAPVADARRPGGLSRFVRLSAPLLHWWARRAGLQASDAADLIQDDLVILVQKLPEFSYDLQGSFRGWLQTVMRNRWREKRRRASLPLAPGEPDLDALEAAADALGEQEYHTYVSRRALELMQAEFRDTTWKACWEQVVNGRAAAEVAAELGISEGAAYVAKCRVLRRLREELADLVE